MSSSIPGAVTAFFAIAQDALPANFQVRFAQIFGPNAAAMALLITGVHVSLDSYAELGPNYRHEEHFTISCSLSSVAGTDDELTRMGEVYTLYDAISVAIANNPRLNTEATDAVRLAWCRQLSYSPTYDGKGLSIGQLDFEVYCEQRVLSLS